jgi:hypothetical protein
MAQDVALLRRYEPLLRFTAGEAFYPLDPEDYVRRCSLWVKRPGREPQQLVAKGALELEDLAQARKDVFGAVHYLDYAQALPTRQRAQATVRFRRQLRKRFQAGPGRLARVGYVSRFIDALFTLVLLLRGRLPGGAAAAAHTAYTCTPGAEKRSYCSRVVREDDWLVLQYWFFYAYNNWRSGFFGANDHEADWEMVSIYLARDGEGEGKSWQPEWVAYAAHDFGGDDLRRHWEDPELERIDGHPVVYPAAGSHASYFTRGEYLTEIELPLLRPLSRLAQALGAFWHGLLRQYRVPDELEAARAVGPAAGDIKAEGVHGAVQQAGRVFRVPFVDYARGDGLSIGPGGEEAWSPPRMLSPTPPWARDYRGLWGLYARDPFAGEDAPAGPRFARDGSLRRAWQDPVGWAGLDKVVPRTERLARARRQRVVVAGRRDRLHDELRAQDDQLEALSIEAEAMRGRPHLLSTWQAHRARIDALAEELAGGYARLAVEQSLLEALDGHLARLEQGEALPYRAHLRRPLRPAPETALRLDRWAELWAAISIGLAMITFVAIWFALPDFRMAGLVAAVSVFVFIEAGFRGRLTRLVTRLTLTLAVAASLVLLYEFFWQVVIVAVLLTGGYIMWENLRELWV